MRQGNTAKFNIPSFGGGGRIGCGVWEVGGGGGDWCLIGVQGSDSWRTSLSALPTPQGVLPSIRMSTRLRLSLIPALEHQHWITSILYAGVCGYFSLSGEQIMTSERGVLFVRGHLWLSSCNWEGRRVCLIMFKTCVAMCKNIWAWRRQ